MYCLKSSCRGECPKNCRGPCRMLRISHWWSWKESLDAINILREKARTLMFKLPREFESQQKRSVGLIHASLQNADEYYRSTRSPPNLFHNLIVFSDKDRLGQRMLAIPYIPDCRKFYCKIIESISTFPFKSETGFFNSDPKGMIYYILSTFNYYL